MHCGKQIERDITPDEQVWTNGLGHHELLCGTCLEFYYDSSHSDDFDWVKDPVEVVRRLEHGLDQEDCRLLAEYLDDPGHFRGMTRRSLPTIIDSLAKGFGVEKKSINPADGS
jgi:hypothetical protein